MLTAQEIADALDVPRDAADGLIKFLMVSQCARFRGERANPSGRGKGAHLYEILPTAKQAVGQAVDKLMRVQ